MTEKQKNKGNGSEKEDAYLPDFMNKVVVCETVGGKTITGVLAGYDRYTMVLIEMKDIKSPNPKKTMLYKSGVASLREME